MVRSSMGDDRRTLDDICGTVFRTLRRVQDLCPDLVPLPDTTRMTDDQVKRLARDLPHGEFRRNLGKLSDLVQGPAEDDRED